jgi:hypothetical protein
MTLKNNNFWRRLSAPYPVVKRGEGESPLRLPEWADPKGAPMSFNREAKQEYNGKKWLKEKLLKFFFLKNGMNRLYPII